MFRCIEALDPFMVFPGYGEKNHQELVSIAQKYGPHGVFQTLMPGGFKVY